MRNPTRRVLAAGLTGLILAAALAVPVAADGPRGVPALKAEPRRVAEYRPNQPFTHDTDLLSQSGYAAWMIDELLQSVTPLPRLGSAFTTAERTTGINARYLVAHAILESGWGTSWIARVKRNLFGYGAYDRDPARYAVRFSSFEAGIAAVSNQIREAYLSPDGRWWRGFPTLRGVNRFYASDPLWAEKVAVLANEIDYLVVTLRERGLNFGWPHLATPSAVAAAGAVVVVEVPWTSRTLGLPASLEFAYRWTPVALAEGSPAVPPGPPASTWTPVAHTERIDHAVRLALRTPPTPGAWRLDIEARDSDGQPLPASDARPIRPLALHVAAATEATISVGLDVPSSIAAAGAGATPASETTPLPGPPEGTLVATLSNVGRTTIPAFTPDGTPTLLEAWSLPLATGESATQLCSTTLGSDLHPGGRVTFQVPRPASTAVVVLRLSGDPLAIGRTEPVAVLFTPTAGGDTTLTNIRIPDLRDASLLPPAPGAPDVPAASAPVASAPAASPTLPHGPGASVAPAARPAIPTRPTPAHASAIATDVPGELVLGLVPASTPVVSPPATPVLGLAAFESRSDPRAVAGPPSLLVRTVSTAPATPVLPTAAVLLWPSDDSGALAMTLRVGGVPVGIRLVLVGVVADGALAADPATLELTWVPIAEPGPVATPV